MGLTTPLDAWHQFQHAYFAAPRTRSGGRIIGGITCRPQFDAMAAVLGGWPLDEMVRLDHSCCSDG